MKTTTLGTREPGALATGHLLKTVSDTDVIAMTRALGANATFEELGSDSSSIITSLDVKNRGPRIIVRPEAKLRAVMEISQNLARSLKTEDVLSKILESLFKIFPQADRGFVVLKDPSTGALQVKSQRTRRENQADSARLSMTILLAAMEKGRAILSEDAASDQRFLLSESVSALRIR